ncbi:RNaseH domain-containing protein [Streptomyces sp. NPDC059627]
MCSRRSRGGPAREGALLLAGPDTGRSSQFDSAVEADKMVPRPLRQGPNKGKPTIDTPIPAWNPGLMEIAVLGSHADAGDSPEALALDALSLPLHLNLASLAQHYVLPTVAEAEAGEAEESPLDELATAEVAGNVNEDPGLAQAPEDEQLALFP